MSQSTTPRDGSRPMPSPLQLRLDPDFERENPKPSPRASSLDSQTSMEDIEALEIPDIMRTVSPVVGYVEEEFPETLIKLTPQTEKAAVVLQKWTKNSLRIDKTLKGLTKADCMAAMSRLFGPHSDDSIALLNEMKKCDGNQAITLSNSTNIAKDVLLFLTSLPRDSTLRKLPVTLHGPRAFLAGALVITHPSVIMGVDISEQNMSDEAKLLKNASSMLMVSSKCLSKILLDYASHKAGQRRRFRQQLIMVRFARRYHASAFSAFKKADAARVVDQLLHPYAELVAAEIQAKRVRNNTMATAARSRMEQIRESVVKLIGTSSAEVKLQEVEAAIQQQFVDTFGENLPSDQHPSSDETDKSNPASSSTGVTAEEPTASGVDLNQIESSLMNEQIAHELILDPKYQLPELDEPKPFEVPSHSQAAPSLPTPASGLSLPQMEAQIAATMQDLFWKKLIKSLTPVKQRGREDFKENTVVQAKYGGANGTFYDARITKVHEDGTFDIKYIEDNIQEEKCSITQFRTTSDPIDPRPLISLLNEVVGRIEKATPHRKDLHEKYRTVLDLPLLTQMLQKGAMDERHMTQLIDFFLDTLGGLEAPARATRTLAWKEDFHNYIKQLPLSARTAEPSPFLLVLPQLFTFLHTALNQLQRDTVNVHLSMIAGKFQGEEGITYERKHFEDKLNKGITSLVKTHTWLNSHMQAFCESQSLMLTEKSVDGKTYEMRKQQLSSRDASKHSLYRRQFIEFACLELIAKAEFRWDSNDAAQYIPETLVLDAPRLAQARDSMDRIVLTSTLLVLLRQVLAKKRIALSTTSATQLQSSLCEMLKAPTTRLPDLQQAVVDTAHEACRVISTNTASASCSGLGEADESYLRGLVSNAANPTNAIFALFTKRVLQLFKLMISYDKTMNSNGKTFESIVDEALGSTGLSSFRSEIIDIGRTLNRFIRLNANVYAPFYSTVCEDVGKVLPAPHAALTA